MSGRRLPAALLLFTLAAVGSIWGEVPKELSGILTQVKGTVQVTGPGVLTTPLGRVWQVVRFGVRIQVPEGGGVGIVCSNRHFIRLQGPVSWELSETTCSGGRELTPSQYALIAPRAGRFKVVDGLLTLEREMRGDDGIDPLAPLILSPRQTSIRSRRPPVSWRRVPTAVEYRVEWSGPSEQQNTQLSAKAACSLNSDEPDLCIATWRHDCKEMDQGQAYFLRVASRGDKAESWHWSNSVKVRTASSFDSMALESSFRELDALGLEGPILEAAYGGTLAQKGFYLEAADAFLRVLAVTPIAEIRLTLGDIDLAMGLHRRSEIRYREALDNGSIAVRAAAFFGLGRVEYSRARYHEARTHFHQAWILYSELMLEEELKAARLAEERSWARSPK